MQLWNALHEARWKYRTQLRHVLTIGKNLLSSNSRCLHNMVNFGPLEAEIGLVVLGMPANFNGFCVLSMLLHSTPVVRVSQTLRRWTEGANSIRPGGHHVGHWPTFLVEFDLNVTWIHVYAYFEYRFITTLRMKGRDWSRFLLATVSRIFASCCWQP